MFTQHRIMFESGKLDTDFSRLYFFLPSITDRCEGINQHMNCVNIHPFDLEEKEFGAGFQPNSLNFATEKKNQMTGSVAKMLKRIAEISNSDLVKNADGLLIKELLILKLNGLIKTSLIFPKINSKLLINFF